MDWIEPIVEIDDLAARVPTVDLTRPAACRPLQLGVRGEGDPRRILGQSITRRRLGKDKEARQDLASAVQRHPDQLRSRLTPMSSFVSRVLADRTSAGLPTLDRCSMGQLDDLRSSMRTAERVRQSSITALTGYRLLRFARNDGFSEVSMTFQGTHALRSSIARFSRRCGRGRAVRTIIPPPPSPITCSRAWRATVRLRQVLEQCSCSIDVIASILPYEEYVEAETVLSARQVGGEKGALFRGGENVQNMVAD